MFEKVDELSAYHIVSLFETHRDHSTVAAKKGRRLMVAQRSLIIGGVSLRVALLLPYVSALTTLLVDYVRLALG